ncbi:DUF6786 family protein [Chitinophaga lutea]
MKKYLFCSAILLAACGQRKQPAQTNANMPVTHQETIDRPDNFGADLAFLQDHVKTIVLRDSTSKAAIAVVPAWQGRVVTSTAAGDDGRSLGWMNHSLIADGKPQPHMNAYGGEDRFWLGPEGSQHSFYFAPGDTFDFAHWQVPAPIDTEAFDVVDQGKGFVTFEKNMQLTNYKGHVFDIKVERTVTLIARRDIRNYLGQDLHRSVHAVAFHSANTIINAGKHRWDTATGMPSVWILGMFPASPTATVIVPLRDKTPAPGAVNDDYFGKVPSERLRIKGQTAYFKADANFRSKIGVKQAQALNMLGSYDAERKLLTIVQFTMPSKATRYVNSTWGVQSQPFSGDALNAYTDGPPAEGQAQMGKFYELESSSPAAALRPGGKLEHYHRTIHLQGDDKRLDPIVQKLFGVTLADVKKALE